MYPSFRGENHNRGNFELCYGEVRDAVAATRYISSLPYVDSNRVYVMGHSTGGTLALLLAETTDKVRAVFSMGGSPDLYPLANNKVWGNTFPFDVSNEMESYLHSPGHFVSSTKIPTFYFEGAKSFYCRYAREM